MKRSNGTRTPICSCVMPRCTNTFPRSTSSTGTLPTGGDSRLVVHCEQVRRSKDRRDPEPHQKHAERRGGIQADRSGWEWRSSPSGGRRSRKCCTGPTSPKREEPSDYARRLTDHKKDGGLLQHSPAITPQGDKIAFISDRDDYFDVYLINAVDGTIIKKLVSGSRPTTSKSSI